MNAILETIHQLFISTDAREWEKLEKIFADKVVLDYSSMNGNPAVTLSPSQIIEGWKTILPGFTHTHHQIGNGMTKDLGDKAEVFCYGTATHYLESEEGNVWTVVGSYNFELEKENDNWRVTKMKFNFKYQDGNTSLPELAMKNVNA
ncbi:nuclear transport factor 2 family protein [Flammeovirga sp. MY04]|uniref:nuclear transport factor 2 family protein n=1 Tax=Flammeovirga sp. MY04 TaxID=1191459 RepID=UPI00080607F4|nr:nuclear transport factor 2 family protein [Flammeovirga sp. MY04]ANQ49462.1 nuclear transport factor 2 family protein [Flammeovirga sp. MY04]